MTKRAHCGTKRPDGGMGEPVLHVAPTPVSKATTPAARRIHRS
ncbi:MAG TPA: hypothetical protein VEQ40_08950 [Pyrinomonadaceae bacterium]|nr:hypothetical protein [Pyrinomonadaceae bacterium]